MSAFVEYCQGLIQRARAAGWEVAGERAIPYGRLYELARGGATGVVNCYQGKKGLSAVVAGKEAAQLREDLGLGAGAAPATLAGSTTSTDPFSVGSPRIGGDESGKGDYFGPLVVAAFLLTDSDTSMLAGLGVRDSKSISNNQVEQMAERITDTGRGAVLSLAPPEYNARYAQVKNLNLLLSQLYGECMRPLLQRAQGCQGVVIDRYTTKLEPLVRALALPKGLKLVAEPRGERDLAVAAASVLARAAFLEGLRSLGHEFGTTFPAGAGDPVLRAGRAFVRSFGGPQLEQVAKVHFATTGQL